MNNILITGASSAIGKSLIELIDKRNLTIIAHYNKSKNFKKFLKNGNFKSKIICISSDFSKSSHLRKFLNKISKYKIENIIHISSKRITAKRFNLLNDTDYASEIKLSFNSIFNILKLCLKSMTKKNKGKIIFILSSSVINAPAYFSQYVCIKYLLLGLMKSLTAEYKKTKIKFIALSPTMMETPFIQNLNPNLIYMNKLQSKSKKFLKPINLAKKIKNLLSLKSKVASGTNLSISI